jgi:hypothetical protein
LALVDEAHSDIAIISFHEFGGGTTHGERPQKVGIRGIIESAIWTVVYHEPFAVHGNRATNI